MKKKRKGMCCILYLETRKGWGCSSPSSNRNIMPTINRVRDVVLDKDLIRYAVLKSQISNITHLAEDILLCCPVLLGS